MNFASSVVQYREKQGTSKMPDRDIYEASDAVKAHWPMAEGMPISGNDINGLGVAEKIPMTPVFWRPDGTVTHIDVQNYFYQRDADNERIREARTMREETFSIPINGLATEQEDRDPEELVPTCQRVCTIIRGRRHRDFSIPSGVDL